MSEEAVQSGRSEEKPKAAWTLEALEALGPVTDVSTTASVVDVSEWTVYERIRRGEWQLTRVLRIGRKIKIPTQDLIRLLYGEGA
ncbi:hypothetical protein [Actinomadura opuntiae]|uniref:hypothetical protein n=1 Tax=Actinomadura sp. OS1-43 TaxID=604315 RepID=UPI00255B101D|nr:hypothetical protein [Actinomadura sp. OS1-43]MDL4815489.1 hypothetical protein [Actinomadura sp. OS1-43]